VKRLNLLILSIALLISVPAISLENVEARPRKAFQEELEFRPNKHLSSGCKIAGRRMYRNWRWNLNRLEKRRAKSIRNNNSKNKCKVVYFGMSDTFLSIDGGYIRSSTRREVRRYLRTPYHRKRIDNNTGNFFIVFRRGGDILPRTRKRRFPQRPRERFFRF